MKLMESIAWAIVAGLAAWIILKLVMIIITMVFVLTTFGI